MKKVWSCMLALVMLLGIIPTAMAQTEVVFWHTYSEGEEKVFLEEVLPAFEAANPDIHVQAIRMPYEGFNQQIITAVAGGVAPDVVRMDLTWVAQMAKLGAFSEALDEKAGFAELSANALPGPMATTLFKGQHFGLPLNTNTTTGVFNLEALKALGFDAPPVTLDELINAVADPANEKWAFAVQGSFSWGMLPFLWTLGGDPTDEAYTTATGYLNSEATVQALETIKKWYDDEIISPSILGEEPATWGGVEAGNYAMIVEGPWFYSGDSQKPNHPSAPIPSVDGRSQSIVGGEDIVMMKNTKNAEAAWTFMQYMLGDQAQLAMTKAGMIPTMASALDQVDTSATPWLAAFLEQLKTAKPRTPSAQWPAIEEILNATFESVLRGGVSAQEGLDAAAAQD